MTLCGGGVAEKFEVTGDYVCTCDVIVEQSLTKMLKIFLAAFGGEFKVPSVLKCL